MNSKTVNQELTKEIEDMLTSRQYGSLRQIYNKLNQEKKFSKDYVTFWRMCQKNGWNIDRQDYLAKQKNEATQKEENKINALLAVRDLLAHYYIVEMGKVDKPKALATKYYYSHVRNSRCLSLERLEP